MGHTGRRRLTILMFLVAVALLVLVVLELELVRLQTVPTED